MQTKVHPRSSAGFSFIELMVVLGIIAILAIIVFPLFKNMREESTRNSCLANQRIVDESYSIYLTKGGTYNPVNTADVNFLVQAGLLVNAPICKDNGIYSWSLDANNYPRINCSVHGSDSPVIVAPLTPLGSTLPEISGAMVQLIDSYYTANGRYPRTWAPYTYTDIGLNAADWQAPVNHIIFSPGGNRINIKPESGYQFLVTDINGNSKKLTDTSNWSLVYSITDRNWYYKAIPPSVDPTATQLEISTLQIQKR
ncbi:MAG: prepilin-type N-terminal cleavage/methylation domain-containing protein [Bacillota bacterium]